MEILSEFLRYYMYENLANINEGRLDRNIDVHVLFTVLRGKTETFGFGLSDRDRK